MGSRCAVADNGREALQRRANEARADFLGRRVREVWVEWASRQSDAKDSWLVGWDDLDGGQREVDRLIGIELAKLGRSEADNAITWFTTCFNCSILLDSVYAETVRAEKAEAALSDAVKLAEDYESYVSELRFALGQVAPDDPALLKHDAVPNDFDERLERARAVLRETEG